MTKRKIEYWVIPHDPDCPVVCMGEQPVQLPDPDSACRTVESPTLSPFSPKSPRGLLEQSRHGGPSIGNSQSTQLATKRSVSTPIVRLDRAIGLPDDIGWERQTGLVQTWRSAPREGVMESIFNLLVKPPHTLHNRYTGPARQWRVQDPATAFPGLCKLVR